MKGGEKLYDQIDSAIRLHDKLLLVLSEQSLQSEWVLTEKSQSLALDTKPLKKNAVVGYILLRTFLKIS